MNLLKVTNLYYQLKIIYEDKLSNFTKNATINIKFISFNVKLCNMKNIICNYKILISINFYQTILIQQVYILSHIDGTHIGIPSHAQNS